MVLNELHWFNPENEITLALNTANYTPSKAVREVRDAGALLPLWYGRKGDAVMTCGANPEWVAKIRCKFNIDIDVVSDRGLSTLSGLMPSPWGWSQYARAKFKRAGVSLDLLPDDTLIDNLYRLTSRGLGVMVVNDFNFSNSAIKLGRAAIKCTDLKQTMDAISELHGKAYLKVDYSSSGRGVMCVADYPADHIYKAVGDATARGLRIFVEPAYDRAFEFALIFEYDRILKRYKFSSTSVFSTDSRGAYKGNLLAPESIRRAKVEKYTGDRIMTVRDGLERLLTRYYAPFYKGVIGVDMLVAKDATLALMEINMRKTMGYVANCFYDRYVAQSATGSFRSMVLKGGEMPSDSYSCIDSRIISGRILLSPPADHFAYYAEF